MRANGFTHESTANESKEWYTPKPIFDALRLRFELDVCSPGADVVPWIPAEKHLTIFDDGLSTTWGGTVWVNPPYGMDTPKWMRALSKHGDGVALVFARPDTKWFQEYVALADVVCFISRRVQFIPAMQAAEYARGVKLKNSGSGAGSMLVGYGEAAYTAIIESDLGLCMFPEENRADEIGQSETYRTEPQFGGDMQGRDPASARPHENHPGNAETQPGLFSQRDM